MLTFAFLYRLAQMEVLFLSAKSGFVYQMLNDMGKLSIRF